MKPTKPKRVRHPCNYPDCPEKAKTRGLCLPHYVSANSMLRSGEASEDDLIARGFMTVRIKGGRPRGVTRYDVFAKGNETRGRGFGDMGEEE